MVEIHKAGIIILHGLSEPKTLSCVIILILSEEMKSQG